MTGFRRAEAWEEPSGRIRFSGGSDSERWSPLPVWGEGQGEGATSADTTGGAPSPSAPKLGCASLRAGALSPTGRGFPGTFAERRHFGPSRIKSGEKAVENAGKVGQDVVVPEADDGESQRRKFLVSHRIPSALGVLSTVDFNNHGDLETGEVRDPSTYRHLPSQLEVTEPTIPYSLPEAALRIGHPASKRLRASHSQSLHSCGTPGRSRLASVAKPIRPGECSNG